MQKGFSGSGKNGSPTSVLASPSERCPLEAVAEQDSLSGSGLGRKQKQKDHVVKAEAYPVSAEAMYAMPDKASVM